MQVKKPATARQATRVLPPRPPPQLVTRTGKATTKFRGNYQLDAPPTSNAKLPVQQPMAKPKQAVKTDSGNSQKDVVAVTTSKSAPDSNLANSGMLSQMPVSSMGEMSSQSTQIRKIKTEGKTQKATAKPAIKSTAKPASKMGNQKLADGRNANYADKKDSTLGNSGISSNNASNKARRGNARFHGSGRNNGKDRFAAAKQLKTDQKRKQKERLKRRQTRFSNRAKSLMQKYLWGLYALIATVMSLVFGCVVFWIRKSPHLIFSCIGCCMRATKAKPSQGTRVSNHTETSV